MHLLPLSYKPTECMPELCTKHQMPAPCRRLTVHREHQLRPSELCVFRPLLAYYSNMLACCARSAGVHISEF
jgi:hypothetical protein